LLLRLEPNQEFTDALKQEIILRNRRLPDFKRVGGYLLCAKDFPRTASMKIKRNELAEDVGKVLGRAAVVEL
jgi:acyl-coenzyme A synthetase/AMP-(fatty) acid ligase